MAVSAKKNENVHEVKYKLTISYFIESGNNCTIYTKQTKNSDNL